jgi:dihydroorotase
MVFKVVPDLAPADVVALCEAGAIGGKLYPQGVTTNSADGASDIDALYPIFDAMEEADLVLEIHAEEPGVFSLDRERAFLPRIERIAARFPRLRIVIEHISSADAVAALDSLPTTVAATVTVHHLLLTLDDVVGDELRPHHFCKPIAKRPTDRDAICAAVLSGNRRVFFGSDSAPHLRGDKESDCGCAGVYTAPVAVPLLAEFFDRAGVALTGREPSLEAFMSRYGAEFYRLPRNERTITLVESETVIPGEYDGVVPFRAGTRLRYDAVDGQAEEDGGINEHG